MTTPLFSKVLIANRGEVALRIARALHDLGIASVAVYADDDAQAPHVHAAIEAVALGATGPAAYLDAARLLAIAQATGCDALHPGYGFLSERADFAQACQAAGLRFIGPTPAQLALFGDKAQARALAQRARQARRAVRGRAACRLGHLPARGAGRVWRSGRLRGTPDGERASHRGAGAGRRHAGDRPGRARMYAAAALSKTG